jgi:hypothetical protein
VGHYHHFVPHFVAASWNPGMAHRPGYRVDVAALIPQPAMGGTLRNFGKDLLGLKAKPKS